MSVSKVLTVCLQSVSKTIVSVSKVLVFAVCAQIFCVCQSVRKVFVFVSTVCEQSFCYN